MCKLLLGLLLLVGRLLLGEKRVTRLLHEGILATGGCHIHQVVGTRVTQARRAIHDVLLLLLLLLLLGPPRRVRLGVRQRLRRQGD